MPRFVGPGGPPRKAVPTKNLFGFAERVKIDAELLALFVEVRTLESQGFCDVGHVEIVAANFGEEDFAFEGFRALLESSLPRRGFRGRCSGGEFTAGEGQTNIVIRYGVFGGEQDQTLDNIAEFTNVAGPGIAAKFGDGVVRKDFLFPAVLMGDLLREMGDESRKIFLAFAERGRVRGKTKMR